MKRWLSEHNIFWHGKRTRREGLRYWLHFRGHVFHVQIAKHRSSTGFSWKWGGQEIFVSGNIIAYYGLFWGWQAPPAWNRHLIPRDGKYGEITREIRLSWHSGNLWWEFCARQDEWRSSDPWWMHHTFHVSDWILGRPRYSRVIVEEGIPVSITIGQWEGDGPYTGTAMKVHSEWKRRFTTKRVDDYEISMDAPGLPFPGKGENSWDCGDDGLYGFGGAPPLEATIERAIADVKKYRERYGGAEWRPEQAQR